MAFETTRSSSSPREGSFPTTSRRGAWARWAADAIGRAASGWRGGPRTEGGPGAGGVLIRRVCVRYGDGRMTRFVPYAGQEFFSRDDAHGVVGSCTREIGRAHV